jgi:hypothetical protein
MAKCLNCDKDAVYLIEKRGQKPQTFCEKDLPWAWKNATPAEGLKKIDLEVVTTPKPVVEEPKKTSTKKSEEPEVEDNN